MSSDDAFLHELELDVRAELSQVEASQPEAALDAPVEQWMFDPADAQREQAGLRSLLGAVESLEDRP